MTERVSPELEARMIALVREAAKQNGYGWDGKQREEAQAIVAELPEPIDPDLLQAREIAAQYAERAASERGRESNWPDRIRSGKVDGCAEGGVGLALDAIRRGRELAAA